VLLYGLEACPLNKTQTQSLDFVINRLFTKLFNTSDIALVKQCQEHAVQFHIAQRCTRTSPHESYTQALLRWLLHVLRPQYIHVRSFVLTLHCHCSFFICFLCHYYFCCILQSYVVNKDFHKPCFDDHSGYRRHWRTQRRVGGSSPLPCWFCGMFLLRFCPKNTVQSLLLLRGVYPPPRHLWRNLSLSFSLPPTILTRSGWHSGRILELKMFVHEF